LSQLLAGCERASEVWHYFEYNDKMNKSSCLVRVESVNKPCGLQLVGRNPTNHKVKWNDLNIFLRSNDIVTTDPLTHSDFTHSQVAKYMDDIRRPTPTPYQDALTFWASRRPTYDPLASWAEDLIAAPASQAYVKRIFSLCGLFTARRRNRMSQNLEIRVFVKLNKQLVD